MNNGTINVDLTVQDIGNGLYFVGIYDPRTYDEWVREANAESWPNSSLRSVSVAMVDYIENLPVHRVRVGEYWIGPKHNNSNTYGIFKDESTHISICMGSTSAEVHRSMASGLKDSDFHQYLKPQACLAEYLQALGR